MSFELYNEEYKILSEKVEKLIVDFMEKFPNTGKDGVGYQLHGGFIFPYNRSELEELVSNGYEITREDDNEIVFKNVDPLYGNTYPSLFYKNIDAVKYHLISNVIYKLDQTMREYKTLLEYNK